MLLHTMKYFKQFLGDVGPGQDAEISVQCDVVTFEWLMAYTKAGKAEDDPVMNLDNCLRIMISSSFLKMQELLARCVVFVADNLVRLAHMAVDLTALEPSLINKISKVNVLLQPSSDGTTLP
eukprot:jgi/Chrzof1/8601/Cz03g16290.t1